MGEFKAGVWLVGLFLYFFCLFIIVNQVIIAADHYGVETDARFNDPGFENFNADFDVPDAVNSSSQGSMSDIKNTLSVITAIGAADIRLGVPLGYVYIFSILFFWIEFFILLWALYMAIPFFH